MMFDPPDFPYKELTESIREHYGADDLIFNNTTVITDSISNDLVKVTESLISNVENELSFNSNISGRYFNIQNSSTMPVGYVDNDENSELFVVPTDNLLNYEPTLLDDNTVNQFLLPVQVTSNKLKETEDNGPDLLALHSCVICHEIFTTDTDLLDHTVSAHASETFAHEPAPFLTSELNDTVSEENTASSSHLECEWLVCKICERVLSTALESQPQGGSSSTIQDQELICCSDLSGESNVNVRKFSTMFVCDYCSYLFANGEALDRHKLTCLGQDEYYPPEMDQSILESRDHQLLETCDIIEKQYSKEPNQRRTCKRKPYTAANSNKMWNCGSCNQLFATARELYRHKRGEDRPPGTPLMAYVCEECDKVLGSMCALHTHKKMHKISKPGYPCRVCSRRFNQSGHLAIHMRMHTGERPYPCDLCPKAFKVKVERDDHRRTHTGERPFACTLCPKTFTAAARLREHARIHTDQRPYKCDICGAAFRRPYARTVHTLIHTGEKPHECDVCGTAFRRSGDMWKHKRTLHGIQTATDGN